MRNRNRLSILACFVAAMILPAMADPASGQPWPEAHSGSYLGVQITSVTPQRASVLKLQEPSGAVITYVDQDGPACHAGLMENDVVVAYEGSKVDGPEQLQGLIHATPPQKTVTLTIVRNGQRKEMKVTLGSWNVMSHAVPAIAMGSPALPHVTPDLEIPSFTVISARHGLVVESLSPQLSDFFGVQRGMGVLVRSVERGSPAAAAGLKAGDVILKINNDPVRDMADWQRGMRTPSPKIPVTVWRDKREQTVVITVSGTTSKLDSGDWLNFDTQVQALRDDMQQIPPEIEAQKELMAQLGPSQKELEQMRSEIEKSLKSHQQDIDKMTHELAASTRPTQKEMEQLRDEIQRSMPSQKDFDEMKRQIQQSMPTQQRLDEMKRQALASMPSQKDLDEMRRQIESSRKEWAPKLQQQMDELKKQMDQQKLDLQKMLPELNNDRQF